MNFFCFSGIAFCNIIIMIYGNIHYTVIFTWITKFIVMSFSPVLPWTSCNHTWNTENCVVSSFYQQNSNLTQHNLTFDSDEIMSGMETTSLNEINQTSSRQVSASEEFLKWVKLLSKKVLFQRRSCWITQETIMKYKGHLCWYEFFFLTPTFNSSPNPIAELNQNQTLTTAFCIFPFFKFPCSFMTSVPRGSILFCLIKVLCGI